MTHYYVMIEVLADGCSAVLLTCFTCAVVGATALFLRMVAHELAPPRTEAHTLEHE